MFLRMHSYKYRNCKKYMQISPYAVRQKNVASNIQSFQMQYYKQITPWFFLHMDISLNSEYF